MSGRRFASVTEAPPAAAPRPDPAPLTFAQLGALGTAVVRELGWGLRQARAEHARWRQFADRIPDPALRVDALEALEIKRYYADGAVLFWILPRRRAPGLVSLLSSFQIAANYLDITSERGAARRGRCGDSLMLALVDAVNGDSPMRDYYADHLWSNDGGYLRALVSTCRARCASLVGYGQARDLLLHEAGLLRALELEHDPDPERRDLGLQHMAETAYPDDADGTWLELAGAGSAALTVIVLLALAADPGTTRTELEEATRVYTRVGGLATMLDGYVDQFGDGETGAWNSIASYESPEAVTDRIAYLIDASLREARDLRHGERHTVIVASMIALYLSHDSATGPQLASSTDVMVRAGGSLTRTLVPALRAWRVAYAQRAN